MDETKRPRPLHLLTAFALLLFVPANAPPSSASGETAPSSDGGEAPRDRALSKIGTKQVLLDTFTAFNDERTLAVSAGATFYGLLALFPAIASFISIFSLFGNFSTISAQLDSLDGFLPGGALDLIREQIANITSKGSGALGTAFAIGLATSLWSANAGMKAMFDSLNVAYGLREERSFLKLNASALVFTLCFLLVTALAATLLVILPPLLAYVLGSGMATTTLSLGRWPALFLILSLGIAALYRFGPSPQDRRWRWLSPGTIFATIAWCVVSAGFSYYAAHFGSYNATYGSLGAAIGLMTWMWLSISIILLGAELNAQIEKSVHGKAGDIPDAAKSGNLRT